MMSFHCLFILRESYPLESSFDRVQGALQRPPTNTMPNSDAIGPSSDDTVKKIALCPDKPEILCKKAMLPHHLPSILDKWQYCPRPQLPVDTKPKIDDVPTNRPNRAEGDARPHPPVPRVFGALLKLSGKLIDRT